MNLHKLLQVKTADVKKFLYKSIQINMLMSIRVNKLSKLLRALS